MMVESDNDDDAREMKLLLFFEDNAREMMMPNFSKFFLKMLLRCLHTYP
jgi:hypothetical protein